MRNTDRFSEGSGGVARVCPRFPAGGPGFGVITPDAAHKARKTMDGVNRGVKTIEIA